MGDPAQESGADSGIIAAYVSLLIPTLGDFLAGPHPEPLAGTYPRTNYEPPAQVVSA